MDLDGIREFTRQMDTIMNFGRGYQCYLQSVMTSGKARLPRRLKKATKKYMRVYHLYSMIIKPQNQFVCLLRDDRLYIAHAKY